MAARGAASRRQIEDAIVAHQVEAAVGGADPDVPILAEDGGDLVAAQPLLGRVGGDAAARHAVQAAVHRPDPKGPVSPLAQHRDGVRRQPVAFLGEVPDLAAAQPPQAAAVAADPQVADPVLEDRAHAARRVAGDVLEARDPAGEDPGQPARGPHPDGAVAGFRDRPDDVAGQAFLRRPGERLVADQMGQAGAVRADPQVGGVVLEDGEDVVVGQALAPGDRLEWHVAELVEPAVARRHPDAAFPVLEQGRDDHPL